MDQILALAHSSSFSNFWQIQRESVDGKVFGSSVQNWNPVHPSCVSFTLGSVWYISIALLLLLHVYYDNDGAYNSEVAGWREGKGWAYNMFITGPI